MSTNILVSSKDNKSDRYIIGTHDGVFHADDVTACAILALYHSNKQVEIIRSKDISFLMQQKVNIMVDVGKGEYDHHQPGGNGKRENGIPYASAGLIWRDYGEKLISKYYKELYGVLLEENNSLSSSIAKEIDEKVIQFIDKEDSGIPTSTHTFSYISSFLPVYNSSYSDFDSAFKLAFDTTVEVLKHVIFEIISLVKSKEDVFHMVKYQGIIDPHILELPAQTFPWIEGVVSHNELSSSSEDSKLVYFVIFPYPSGGWAAHCVPPSLKKRFKQIVPFPKNWAGLSDELPEISGVEDALFCHNNLFFARAKTKKGIISLCSKAINNHSKEKDTQNN